MTARIMVSVPTKARRGAAVEIKTLISHPMETGYRVGPNGAMIPLDIIRVFICTYNGEGVFRAALSPAIAANPFLSFFMTAVESGTLVFRWIGDNGFEETHTAEITVT
jgi:sulfur-oxidizing protein SoxZ